MKVVRQVPALMLGLLSTSIAQAEVSLSGFASVVMGISNNNSELMGYKDDWNAQQESVAAIQFNSEVNEQMSATLQLVSRGEKNWEPDVEWAYLSYAGKGKTFRAGKLKAPIFYYSDYLDVHYAQPTLRPSSTVYDLLPIITYTGVDAIVPVPVGNSSFTIQPFFGSTELETSSGVAFTIDSIAGINATWESNDLVLRFVAVDNRLSSDETPLMDNKDARFLGVSFHYEPNDWFMLGEYASVEVEDQFSDTAGAYLTTGYHIDSITPYITAGMVKTLDDEERSGVYSGYESYFTYQRKEYSLGFRWNFMPNTAIKADVTLRNDFNGTSGVITGLGNENAEYDRCTVASLSVDVIF